MNHPVETELQYEAIRRAAGYFRLPRRSLIEISGADRAAFLHNLCTNDIRQCPAGAGRELFLTSVQGKTLGHGFALVRDNSMWLVTSPDSATTLLGHMDRFIIREDVTLRDLSDQYVEFLLCGPKWMSRIPAWATIHDLWSHTNAGLPIPEAWIVHTAWSTAPHFMLIAPRGDEPLVVSQLEQMGGVHCDDQWFDRLRIEAGFPEYGRDISERNLPQEIDRDRQAISFTKGCYLGQETVARLDALGHVNWRMRGVRAPRDVPLTVGLEIELAGAVIARITSCAPSPRNDQTIGLAMIRSGHSASGTTLDWQGHPITVEDLPLAEH